MLTDSMSGEELWREANADIAWLMTKFQYVQPKLRRLLRTSRVWPAYCDIVLESPATKTIWRIIISATTKDVAVRCPLGFVVYAFLETNHGRGAVRVIPADEAGGLYKILKYVPHFFRRFRERYVCSHLKEDYELSDVVTAFMMNNVCLNISESIHREGIEGQCDCGFFFGTRIYDHVFLVKTFVSYSMLYDSQLDAAYIGRARILAAKYQQKNPNLKDSLFQKILAQWLKEEDAKKNPDVRH